MINEFNYSLTYRIICNGHCNTEFEKFIIVNCFNSMETPKISFLTDHKHIFYKGNQKLIFAEIWFNFNPSPLAHLDLDTSAQKFLKMFYKNPYDCDSKKPLSINMYFCGEDVMTLFILSKKHNLSTIIIPQFQKTKTTKKLDRSLTDQYI